MPSRSQLSLSVPQHIGHDVEAFRRIADPVQSRLISAHVTLCREDELGALGLPELQARLRHAQRGPITLEFGAPEKFGEHGILLPCIDGFEEFQSLREIVLALQPVRPHAPHLTLAHPRNPKAAGNSLGDAAALRAGLRVTFDEVHLIEQVDDSPWVVRGSVPLLAESSGAA
jgi:2'-5' RNA ligase